MNNLSPALVVATLAISVLSEAQALPLGHGFDAEIELSAVSDYRYHGISQTLGDPAVQGGVTLASPIGAYIGTWMSNVDYGPSTATRFEQDYYAGWYIPIGEDFTLDVGWWKYTYQKNSELNEPSYYVVATYKAIELTHQWASGSQAGSYTSLAYTYPFTATTRVKVRYGLNDFKDPVIFSADGNTREHYREWEARIDHDLLGATFSASLVDTDLSSSECVSVSGYDDLCSANLVVGVSKKF
ncbi:MULTISPECIES: TorF family putative porin [Pseudomonas]|uniref:TorF family putative porin n=1 Tax=Pseudomonas TaxID=286 RepID=UPI0009E83162|nr:MULTISPECIES: TorF family putative porin [Pseudomonas]TCV66187.1 uncharacterized protein (TIGR02001 family) [Pseudomonas fluorescens]